MTALVEHLLAEERDIAARCGVQRALIDNFASTTCAAILRKAQLAVVGTRQIKGTGDQATDIDHSTGAKQHTVRVDEEDLTVRVDVPKNGRAVTTQNAV